MCSVILINSIILQFNLQKCLVDQILGTAIVIGIASVSCA